LTYAKLETNILLSSVAFSLVTSDWCFFFCGPEKVHVLCIFLCADVTFWRKK